MALPGGVTESRMSLSPLYLRGASAWSASRLHEGGVLPYSQVPDPGEIAPPAAGVPKICGGVPTCSSS
jgi:hypothetical protein